MTPKRFMIIAGEPSGDLLAAELVCELRAGIMARNHYTREAQPLAADLTPRFFGAGGEQMKQAGVDLAFDLTRHSVIGLSDVLKNYFKFRRLFGQLLELAVTREPHAIICVDFSGFNRRFAAAVQKYVRARRGPFYNWSPKIIQFISPQVWASRAGRIHSIARDFDLLLSIFPFEKPWYAERVPQLRVEFVGHPLLGRFAAARSELIENAVPAPAESPQILLLPGSRKGELDRHLPVMLEAYAIIKKSFPACAALLVLPNEFLAQLARQILSTRTHLQVEIQIGNLSQALAQTTIALASTGTVTMECAFFGVPTVTLYRTSWSTYQIGKRIVKVKSLTMPNLLAGRSVFPEFVQKDATAANLSNAALDLLKNSAKRVEIQNSLREIISQLGDSEAPRRAASAILSLLP